MIDTTADADASRYLVPALERGLRLLGEFTRDTPALSAPELGRRLRLPRSTTFRLLATLERLGYVVRSGNDYRLGLGVLRLGFEYLASLELTELGQPLLARLCDETRLACNLVVRDGRSIVYVAKVTPPTPLASSVHVGTRLPAHATVLGRVLLGDMDLDALRALYPEERLEAFSGNTPRTVAELHEMLRVDRERGYVLGEGFFEASISTVAAPVRERTDRVVAALGITVASARIDPSRVAALVRAVRACADDLSRLLGHRPAADRADTVPRMHA